MFLLIEGAMKEQSIAIYEELKNAGVEVLLDDRNERPGVKFKDIDLLGIPVRIVVSDKNLPNVELKCRNSSEMSIVSRTEAISKVVEIIKTELSSLNN